MQPGSLAAHHEHVNVPPPNADQVVESSQGGGGGAGGEGGDGDGSGGAGGGDGDGGGAGTAAAGGGEGQVPHVSGQFSIWPYVVP